MTRKFQSVNPQVRSKNYISGKLSRAQDSNVGSHRHSKQRDRQSERETERDRERRTAGGMAVKKGGGATYYILQTTPTNYKKVHY